MRQRLVFSGLLLISVSCAVSAQGQWEQPTLVKYLNDCQLSAQQRLPAEQASQFCACTAKSISDSFSTEEIRLLNDVSAQNTQHLLARLQQAATRCQSPSPKN